MTSPTAESAPREVLSLPRRTFTDPNWLQDQADARAYRISVGQLRAFKRRHRLPPDQRLSPDARDLLALELETAERVAKGEQLERTQAQALLAERVTPELAAAVAAVVPFPAQLALAGVPILLGRPIQAYLLKRVEALTGTRYALPGAACKRAAVLVPAAAPAAATLESPGRRSTVRTTAERLRLCLFWGVILRLDQLDGPPPSDPAAFYAWSQLEAYRGHHPMGRDLSDLLAGRIGSGDARRLLLLPESGPLNPAAIRAAYRAQARHHHPDVGGERQRFEQLGQARDRLLLEVEA